MVIAFTTERDASRVLATEMLGFDAALVASIEDLGALGIDVLGLQAQPGEHDGRAVQRSD